MSEMNSPSILVIRSGAIGDTIVMSGVYQALRRKYPHAYIEAMGSAERLPLINTPGLLNKITSIELPDLWTFYIEDAPLPMHLKVFFQRFDIIIAYRSDPDNIFTKNLCKTGVKRVYRFDPFPPKDANVHITEYLLKTLETLGIYEKALFPEIAFPESDNLFSDLPDFHIAIHPGSGNIEKNWAVENFAALWTRLANAYQMKIGLIAGPADEHIVQIIRNRTSAADLVLLQNMPLSTITVKLRRCALYIGNDSGISHIAATIGIPTIVIFGPSNPNIWKPIGKHVIILKGDGRPYCTDVTVERVVTKVAYTLHQIGLFRK